MTYQQISKRYQIPVQTLTRRVHVLKLKGVCKSTKKHFNAEQIKQIVEYNPKAHFERNSTINHRRKIKIIEFYLKFKSVRRTATFLNMSRYIVTATVKEYNEYGTVTVESEMNYE